MKLIILIAHFNNLEGLNKSLLSIQENIPVDVLIVDDGSEERPDIEQLRKCYKNGKLFIEYLEENKGVGIASNHGLKRILQMDYDLTGRLDCGDLAHPHKYEKQIKYLQENPDVKLLGTWVNMMDMDRNLLFTLEHPISYEAIQKEIFINSTFVNSSVIYYLEILEEVGLFPEKYHRNGEDYALFFRVVKKFKCENLPEVLLDYELNPNSLSSKGRKKQVLARIGILKENFQWGFYPIYGLIRSYILLFFPRSITIFLRTRLLKRSY